MGSHATNQKRIYRKRDGGTPKKSITPTQSRILEKDVRWGEFRVGDLFENIQQGSRLKKLDQIDGNLPFIMAGTTNTGLVNYVGNKSVRRFPKNSLTIDIFGNVFYRNYEYAAGDDTGVYWNEKKHLSREVMLYYCTALEVALRGKFSYGKKLRSSQSHDILTSLPATNDNTPNFDYMEDYIIYIQNEYVIDLERKRNLHLNAYLEVTGFDNYELDDGDIEALAREVEWGEFRIGDLFDTIKRGKRIKSLDRMFGDLPFITAGAVGRGFSSYIGNPSAEVFPPNSLTIDMFGTVFYRGHKYGADDHVAILFNQKHEYSKYFLLYVGTCIEKTIKGKFSYSRNFYASDAHDVIISLPATNGNTPDFDYMEAYIKAHQKLATANAIRNLDLEISASKCIVKGVES
ncbi:MAG: restriction endonuclease subunit S [Oscillospiraceae bacterium]|nr:restriction endonuclease subunit S [Oscillospiraceae bacterium]